jgi:flagellar protein FliL
MGDDEKNVVDIEDEESDAPDVEVVSKNASPSKIIKILFYIIGAIILLLLVIGISYVVAKNVQERKYAGEQSIVIAPPPPPLSHYDIPTFSITTKDPEPHFIKLTISLGYTENLEFSSELGNRLPQLQHIINILLGGKSFEELNSIEDKINLSEEIKAHLNTVLSTGKITEVYFKEIIIN